MTDVYFSLAWKHAGLISFGWIQKNSGRHVNIHLFPAFIHQCWKWPERSVFAGYVMKNYGLGPFLLISTVD